MIRTSSRPPDRHDLIATEVLRARRTGTPAAIITRWNFPGFFHFASRIERNRFRIHRSIRQNSSLNSWIPKYAAQPRRYRLSLSIAACIASRAAHRDPALPASRRAGILPA